MKILSTEFIKSCVTPDQYPKEPVPEIAFMGRSNVGKSSAINSLLNRKGLAKVAKTPGKTQTVNFFRVSTGEPHLRSFNLVDLPGYGYAKVPKTLRMGWGGMVESYLRTRKTLCGIMVLVDARGPQDQDVTLIQWLNGLSLAGRMVVVATKSDKVPGGKQPAQLDHIRNRLSLRTERELFMFSARTGGGKLEVLKAMRDLISEKT